MKKITKIVVIILSVTMIMALMAGCSPKKDEVGKDKEATGEKKQTQKDKEPQTKDKEKVTINFWTWYPSAEEYEPLIKEFEEETGIGVELFVIGSADYQKKLPLALASGEKIDVVGVQPNMANQLTTFLEPLEPMLNEKYPEWKDNFNEEDLRQCKQVTDGELYMLNNGSVGDWFIFYNADMIEELGLEVPTTYAEWSNFNQTIRKEKKPDVIPFAYWVVYLISTTKQQLFYLVKIVNI